MVSKEERAQWRKSFGKTDVSSGSVAKRLFIILEGWMARALDALDEADARITELEAEIALTARAGAIVDNLGWEIAPLKARIAELETAARYNEWLYGGDTGMSSKAIFYFMTAGTKGGWTPCDPSDLGRCLRLLERFPEWRERMPEMANCSPKWAEMIPHWGLLEATLLSEVGGLRTRGTATKTYRMMQAIQQGKDPTAKPVARKRPTRGKT